MAADAYIGTRVAAEMKAAFREVAEQQELTESALLKQLLNVMVCRGGRGGSVPSEEEPQGQRNARLCVRLRADDRMLLRERARAREVKPATYVSSLVRSHLRMQAPLLKKELGALVQSVNELGALGRNMNQIARAMNQGNRSGGPSRDELRAILKACGGLRDHVRELLDANLRAWEIGYEETH